MIGHFGHPFCATAYRGRPFDTQPAEDVAGLSSCAMPRSKRNPDLARQIGARIRQLRERTDYTQERLAWDCDIAKGYLSHVEAGRNLPSVAVLATLAARLGAGLIDLVAVEADEPYLALLDAARKGDREAVQACLKRLDWE